MLNPKPQQELGPAAPGDLDAMDRIEREAFTTPWSRDLLRAAIGTQAYRVRVLRSPALGLLGFYIAHTLRQRANLDNLAVDSTLRNQGYGSQLLADWVLHGEQEALEALTLQVNTANDRARQLYERFGFRATKVLVGYYPNGDDAYQMERELTLAGEPAHPGTGRRYWLPSRRSALRSR